MLDAMSSARQNGGGIDDLIKRLTCAEAGAAFLECQSMDQPAGPIGERRRRRLLFRPQILTVDLAGTQAAVPIRLEVVEFVRLGEGDLAREIPPIFGPKGIENAEDLFVVFEAKV